MSLVRNLAQSTLLSAARSLVAVSGRAVLEALRGVGLGYRTQDFYSDYNYWQEAVERGKKIKYSWQSEVLSEDLYMKTGYEMRARYETVCEVTYRDPLTGEVNTQWVTIAHEHLEDGVTTADLSQQLTRGDIEAEAAAAVESESPGGQPEIIHVMPIMGFVNPNVG